MSETPAVETVLADLELFAGADADALERVAMAARPFSLETGEVLFQEGMLGDEVAIVASGRLEGLLRLPGGREMTIDPFSQRELVGEMAVLAQRPRRLTTRAAEPTRGWIFLADEVRRSGAFDRPEAVRRIGRRALERLRAQYDRLSDLCQDDARDPKAPDDEEFPPVPVDPEPGEADYLSTVLFFSQFSAEEREELFGGLRRIEAPRGATVIPAGDSRHPLLFVLRGALETSIRRGGLAARARLAGPGRIAGHLSLLDDEPTPATTRAREHSVLLEVPVERVAEILARGDETGRRFGLALYADVVDALFEAQRPVARMAAAGPT